MCFFCWLCHCVRLCVLARVMRLWRVMSASPKLPLRSSHHSCAACITSPVGDTTCACAHYQFLRFLSLVPYIYTPCQRPRTNQRWTKDEPKNSKTQKSTFIKIDVSFSSLIPCLIPPTDDREKTERWPTQLPAYKKCYFLRLLPKKVFFVPEKVDSFPEKVDLFPNMIDCLLKKIVLFLKVLYNQLVL